MPAEPDNGEPNESHRPGSSTTTFVLTAGTIVAVVLLMVAFAQRTVGSREPADFFGTLGITVLLATPALGLVATFFELRGVQRSAAVLALLVLAILGAATVVALIAG